MRLFKSQREKQADSAQAAYEGAIARHLESGVVFPLEKSNLLAHDGEDVLLERPATLLKEVAEREFRGGSHGISIPLGKGVRYRAGQFRGHSVVTGTSWQPADEGTLSVSSQRIVFAGRRKTVEVPYARLISMELFDDGICFHISGRQNSVLLRVSSPTLVANLANGLMHHDLNVYHESDTLEHVSLSVLNAFTDDPKPRTIQDLWGELEVDADAPDPHSPEALQMQEDFGISPEQWLEVATEGEEEGDELWRNAITEAVDGLVQRGLLAETDNLYSLTAAGKAEALRS